jgi:uncharacterized protein
MRNVGQAAPITSLSCARGLWHGIAGLPSFVGLLRAFPGCSLCKSLGFAKSRNSNSRGQPRRDARVYNPCMPLVDQIQKDIVAAMKAKDEARLSTLRMVKSALQLKTVEKMSPLDDKESQAVLATLIKQRKESIEQFTKGGRQEMADKESAEIGVIETYLPKAASEADVVAGVKTVIAEMIAPTMKDMGTVMKNSMAKFSAAGIRVDGKVVSEVVKRELAGK